MYIKFSKSFDSLFEIKKSFFQNNKSLISENKKLLKILKKQPLRLRCKNCSKKLGKSFDFNSHGINYKFCKNCDHLNSENEDTKSFHNFYEKSQSYSKFYISSKNDFNKRVKNIYTPKLEFLLGYFKNRNKAKIIDLGTGIGHFLKACENKKVQALGLEINSKMIDYGNKFLKKNHIKKIYNFSESKEFILKNNNYNILSLIGVLEHLEKPNQIFEIFNKSKIQFLYLSIPLFSLSAMLDVLFQDTYPRQLPATHPHLYTYSSILHILKKYNLKICGEWWFGSEIFDLYKILKIRLVKNSKNSKKFNDFYDNILKNELDDMQKMIDKKKKSSEVHLIIKK